MQNMRGLLIGLAVALVALVLVNQITSRRSQSTVEGGGFVELVPEGFDEAAVQEVVAYMGASPDSSVELERRGEGWVVPTAWSWPARETLVDRLFTDLTELNAEVRSSDPSVLADYEIGDDQGLHVVAKGSGGSELFHLIAGKNAERGGSFIRRAGSDTVAYTKKTLRSHFGIWADATAPQAKRWLDLQVHRVDRADVDKIRLEGDGEDLVLEKAFAMPEPAESDTAAAPPAVEIDRSTWTWKPDETGAIDKAKADGVLGLVASLNAADVADPDSLASYGLVPPERVAEVTMADGATTRIGFGHVLPSDSTRVYVRIDEKSPAVIQKNTVDRIFVSRESLTPKDES